MCGARNPALAVDSRVAFGPPEDIVRKAHFYGQFVKSVLAKKYVAPNKRGGGVSEAAE